MFGERRENEKERNFILIFHPKLSLQNGEKVGRNGKKRIIKYNSNFREKN